MGGRKDTPLHFAAMAFMFFLDFWSRGRRGVFYHLENRLTVDMSLGGGEHIGSLD